MDFLYGKHTLSLKTNFLIKNEKEYYKSIIAPKEKNLIKQKISFKKYSKLVRKLSEEQPLHLLVHYEKRGFNNYHLDHKVSIWYGWKHNISVYNISHISNLRFIPAKENRNKGRSCTIYY